MKRLSLKEIEKITGGKLFAKDDMLKVSNFSKDSRNIKKNDIYVGIKGSNFDGNLFYKDAIDKGAALSIVDNDNIDTSYGNILIVNNSMEAIKKLALYERDNFKGKVIAVTGSVGKTSTRTIIAKLLSEKYSVLSTKLNYNNEIGLPFTILEHTDEEIMVLEMGMNHLGEIERLSNIAKPDISVITNVGTAHIGILGSRENILKAKMEITSGMNKDGVLILNGDNDLLSTVKSKVKISFCNTKKDEGFYIKSLNRIENNIKITLYNEENYLLENVTDATIMNYLLAINVAKILDLSYEQIKNGLKKVQIDDRMKVIKTSKFVIIDDTYNASLEAVKSAINYLENYKGKRKVAILGDILEVGDFGEKIHREISTVTKNIDLVLTTGDNAIYIGGKHFKNIDELIENMYSYLKEGDVILVKASHGMHFSKIVEELKNK